MPLREENGLQYNIEDIKKFITTRTAAIFINSPMNPTGLLLEDKFLKEIASLGVPVISDEIYHGWFMKDVPVVFWSLLIRLLY